ncbi:MAG: heparinase II/III family protein [Bryobacteraceae bacterium]|nr:heparinase II/III family protein [Bryobacteraceae bacterium]
MRTPVLLFAGVLALARADQDPLAGLRRSHPRLIALETDLERVRGLLARSPQAHRIYRALVEEASRIQTAPPVEHVLIGPRLLAQSRRCLDRIYKLALLYRLDGKREYFERAVRELQAAAAFPDWNPSHFLDTAEMTHAFAIGYDWLYHALNEDQRAWIRQAILDKGIRQALPFYEQQRSWVVNRFNWNQVCNGGIGLGALAIADEEPEICRRVLKYALQSLPRALASYAPDGGWPEGPGYWHYATRYTVYFLAGLETALGDDFGLAAAPGFREAGRFRVYFSSPAGKTFNYADAGDAIGSAEEMFWLARKFREPVYAWHQQQRLEDPSARPGALDLLWYQEEARTPQQAGWPLDALFRGVEVAFLRSSWEDPDAVFVGVKAGDLKVGHSQLDLGTFVLDAGRVRWALDLGADDYNLPGYFGKERWNYYRNRTESHNTLLVDGENQNPKAEAAIVAHRFEPGWAWVVMDLSQAYPGKLARQRRGVGLLHRRHVVIQDEIAAQQPVEALWGMVTDAEVKLEGRGAELRKPGWRLAARILRPEHARFDVVSTTPPPPQNPNHGTRKLVVRLPAKVTDLRLVVALTPHREGEEARRLDWRDRPLDSW